jgi:Cft2 family RNA processing exonuclease
MEKLIALSGLGAKEPAAFVVEARSTRLLLDFGARRGTNPESLATAIGKVDALLLSHQHPDHVGSLSAIAALGNPPVYATAAVHAVVSGDFDRRFLPLHGETEICGVPVRMGRNGHSPGGVWLRLGIGDGLLYMGDNVLHPEMLAADPPPPSATVILDASYGPQEVAFSKAKADLRAILPSGPALLPVPAQGRGVEIALFASQELGLDVWADAGTLEAASTMANPQAQLVQPHAVTALASLLAKLHPLEELAAPQGVMLAGSADCDSGLAARLVKHWRDEPMRIVLTGHVPGGSMAEALCAEKRAAWLRWPVHPGLTENVALVRRVQARRVLPAFAGAEKVSAFGTAFDPAELCHDPILHL